MLARTCLVPTLLSGNATSAKALVPGGFGQDGLHCLILSMSGCWSPVGHVNLVWSC